MKSCCDYLLHFFVVALQDFSNEIINILIPVGGMVGQRFCHSLLDVITNDVIIENDENFRIGIRQSSPLVTLSSNSVEVLIKDTDGKLCGESGHLCVLVHKYYVLLWQHKGNLFSSTLVAS